MRFVFLSLTLPSPFTICVLEAPYLTLSSFTYFTLLVYPFSSLSHLLSFTISLLLVYPFSSLARLLAFAISGTS